MLAASGWEDLRVHPDLLEFSFVLLDLDGEPDGGGYVDW
jgi:hypothetical protein